MAKQTGIIALMTFKGGGKQKPTEVKSPDGGVSTLTNEVQQMKKLSFLVCVLMLAGCQSEVDKCVNAQVKADEPYKNEAARNSTEADARLVCLQAKAGKLD